MTDQFIGMRISLTSRAQLRYRGVVHSIDGNQGTMTLKDVISMGTEDRPAAQFIPPMVDRIHPIVVFTVNDILDLAVEPTTTQALPEDPAIRQSNQTQHLPPPPTQPAVQQPISQQAGPSSQQTPYPGYAASGAPLAAQQPPSQPSMSAAPPSGHHADEIRLQGQHMPGPSRGAHRGARGGRGGQQGGPRGPAPPPIPAEEFDFEQMNRQFEEMRARESNRPQTGSDAKSPLKDDESDDGDEQVIMGKNTPNTERPTESSGPVYNKSKSFFDSVSSDVSNARQGQESQQTDPQGRIGGGGSGFKWQRSQERQVNMDTFGEAGGNMSHRGRGRGRGRGGFRGGRGRGGFRGGSQPGGLPAPVGM